MISTRSAREVALHFAEADADPLTRNGAGDEDNSPVGIAGEGVAAGDEGGRRELNRLGRVV
ncbi:MAG: hypothetical protein M5T61_12385 [Acidimicrobiia bacterium]|nr:hypothetical protein [Acidimicrobiia bacterium]